jgi:hypothetical protein
MTLLKPDNIGSHLKSIETSFQVVPLFFKSFHFWMSYLTFLNFLKILSVFKGLELFLRSSLREMFNILFVADSHSR